MVSIALQECALRDPNPGDTVIFHVQSAAYMQEDVAARDAVRKALEQLEIHTNHCIPDYSFLKMKSLQLNEPDVTQVPKRMWPLYESEFVSYYILDFLLQLMPFVTYVFISFYICLVYI